MNEKGHTINAVLLSTGLAILLEPGFTHHTIVTWLAVTPPIVLGAIFPDLDTTFGTHRQTFHNLIVLGIAITYPYLFGNLHYVWIGILTHYILDLCGNVKGMAIFYPSSKFYDIPVGVRVDSQWADIVTLLVSIFELIAIGLIIHFGYRSQLATPSLPVEIFDWVIFILM